MSGLAQFVDMLRRQYSDGCTARIGAEFAATIVSDYDALKARAESQGGGPVEAGGCAPPVLASPTRHANDWAPIETAPKDGTEILLAVSSYYGWSRVLASWETFGWVDSEVRQVEQGHYVAVHWMPLAPLPTPSGVQP